MKHVVLIIFLMLASTATFAQPNNLVAQTGSDYDMQNSYDALANMINFTSNAANGMGVCKEIGVFSAAVRNFKHNSEYGVELNKKVEEASMKSEIESLYSMAFQLEGYCGDSMNGDKHDQKLVGDRKYLVSQLKLIQPQLDKVLNFSFGLFKKK